MYPVFVLYLIIVGQSGAALPPSENNVKLKESNLHLQLNIIVLSS